MSQVKRSQLVVGQDYYLVAAREENVKKYPATFKVRYIGGIYFEPKGDHPYIYSSLEQFEGYIGLTDSDEFDGFYPVEQNDL